MKRLLLSLSLALSLSSLAQAAATQTGESSAAFQGKGPAGFKLEGKTWELMVIDDGSKVTITVPLTELDTGIDLRNKHMREKYLDTAKYPDAVLVVDRSTIQLPAEGKRVTGKGKGKMTIRGKTKDVDFHYAIKRVNGVYVTQGKVPRHQGLRHPHPVLPRGDDAAGHPDAGELPLQGLSGVSSARRSPAAAARASRRTWTPRRALPGRPPAASAARPASRRRARSAAASRRPAAGSAPPG